MSWAGGQGQLWPCIWWGTFDEVENLQVIPTYGLEKGIFCDTETSWAIWLLSLLLPLLLPPVCQVTRLSDKPGFSQCVGPKPNTTGWLLMERSVGVSWLAHVHWARTTVVWIRGRWKTKLSNREKLVSWLSGFWKVQLFCLIWGRKLGCGYINFNGMHFQVLL